MKQKPTDLSWKQRATLPVRFPKDNDFTDYDYLHKLNQSELDWLKGFTREWICADFNHKFTHVHTTREHKRECYTLNNLRYRDIYNRAKWSGHLLTCWEVQEYTRQIDSFWYKFYKL